MYNTLQYNIKLRSRCGNSWYTIYIKNFIMHCIYSCYFFFIFWFKRNYLIVYLIIIVSFLLQIYRWGNDVHVRSVCFVLFYFIFNEICGVNILFDLIFKFIDKCVLWNLLCDYKLIWGKNDVVNSEGLRIPEEKRVY